MNRFSGNWVIQRESIMAEWSQLLRELLYNIAKKLNSDIDVLRMRSVCSSWRSSVSYPLFYCFPNCIPIHPKVTGTSMSNLGLFYLSRRLILRLGPPESHQTGTSWLIKLEQDGPDMLHLLNPLTGNLVHPSYPTSPKIIDSINFQIFELAQEFVLRFTDSPPYTNPSAYTGDLYMEKVVFSSNPPWSVGTDYAIMTIHVSGKLAVFRSIDNSWAIIDEFISPFDDVVCYKGGFYAVDSRGRAVVVNPSLTISEIAHPIYGGDLKCLVESDGELLMVDRYLSTGLDEEPGNDHNDDPLVALSDLCITESTVCFKVYKLNQDLQTWVELKSLDDCVLFLGDNCSFSASAHEFSGSKGSCIYYTDKFARSSNEEDGTFATDIGVFNLESGNIAPLVSNSGCSQLFWPPPAWVSNITI
ncbi:F-box protein SKIP23-like isoform X1 [Papaver somniferum]|uniref:F-box protein SKIP23-like isoform X1 n=2 Tax=Papaver somniferum TaxID=3469 RepID=UPI000E703B46|nr:F-box protein SKIP23-like isoform X1 [Papaver somniferum]